MLQKHPQNQTVSDEELRQRCAAFKKEVEGEEKSKKRREFEEKWRQEVEGQKKTAEEERRKIRIIDWPEEMDVGGYHPVPGNLGDGDEEEDPLPSLSSADSTKNEDELGESPQYEICDMTDIQIDGIPLIQVPSQTPMTIDVAQEPSTPSLSPTQLTTTVVALEPSTPSLSPTQLTTAVVAQEPSTPSLSPTQLTTAVVAQEPSTPLLSPTQLTPVDSAPTKSDAACQVGLIPMGEEVEESQPKGIVEIPLNAPRYRLVEGRKLSQIEGDRYDQWHKDPRLFFLGAPSTYKRECPFQVLQEARRQALYHPGIRCARTLPHGAGYIERVESMKYADGSTYRLAAFWHEDRKVTDRSSVATQCKPAEE